ncbi:MAG: hypothetical protein KC483_10535 [Nitrosarchaeum sp.]|nr:hypothetical protein [Nitrosarchaeum sp.]MCA9820609.1 hypothetical protein [Nitrosarchaeum sp.]
MSSSRVSKPKRVVLGKKPRKPEIITDNTRLEKYPDVIVYFEYENGLVFVIIENIGNEPAYDTRIRFSKKFWGMQKTKEISSLSIFKLIRFLSPGKKLKILVDSFQFYVAYKQPMNIDVRISFRNKAKQTFQNSIQHDLSIYKDVVEVMTPRPD